MFAEGDRATAVPALVSEASGVVLELGPGIGSQLPRYNTSKVTKVYGVEPNRDLHKALRERVKASGLTDVYEVVPCGIEDVVELKKHGIALGGIDTVLSIQVLCSVPDPDDVLRRLYALMKPGGQLIVYEHVKSKDVVTLIVQSMFVQSFSCRSDGGSRRVLTWESQICTTSFGLFSLATVTSTAIPSTRLCKLERGRRLSLLSRHRKMHGRYSLESMVGSGRSSDCYSSSLRFYGPSSINQDMKHP